MNDSKEVEELLRAGSESPQFVHPRELAALIESLGYNDLLVQGLGFDSTFVLAEQLFPRISASGEREQRQTSESCSTWDEVKRAVHKISLSLAYSVPWIALLIIEYFRPDALPVKPELGSALSLSLIASLITSGGFVQMISRGGGFYFGMKEHVLANRVCMWLTNFGLTGSLLFALMGTLLGTYFHVFESKYLLLAGFNYVALSLLWMVCAILSVRSIGWCIPLAFALSAFTLAVLRSYAHSNATLLLVLWPMIALVWAAACLMLSSKGSESISQATGVANPRLGVMLISLAPSCLYGSLYFSFLFADRLAAGSSIPWTAGLSFGIDLAYKRGMDLVLLAFLITAALVEYLSDSFLRLWQRLATELSQTEIDQMATRLRKRHAWFSMIIISLFALVSVASWNIFAGTNIPSSSRLMLTAAFGGLGYLMLSLALLEIVVLSGMNASRMTLSPLAWGLSVNLVTGYVLSHLLGVEYAAAGLVFGSALVLWKCNAALRELLRRPDYQYSIS